MEMPAWMTEAWAALSDEDQEILVDYIQSLLAQKRPDQGKSIPKPLKYDVFRGRIRVPEHFDDPLL